MNETEFPQGVLKNIQDRSQEKRAQGAKSIEDTVRKIVKQKANDQRISQIIDFFRLNFIQGENNPAKKRGALKVYSSVAQALGEDFSIAEKHVKNLTNIVISQLDDHDKKIQVSALESLYFICKSLREVVLLNFNNIFDKLVDKFGHQFDEEVRKGTQQLEDILKQIINESLPETKYFSLKEFMPILSTKIKANHPIIRSMIIKWIEVFDQIPNVNIIDYLPKLLEDLFLMLGEQNVKNLAQKCLHDFLNQIKESQSQNAYLLQNYDENKNQPDIHNEIVNILIKIYKNEKQNQIIKLTAIEWINEYLLLFLHNQEQQQIMRQTNYSEYYQQDTSQIQEDSKNYDTNNDNINQSKNSNIQQQQSQNLSKLEKSVLNKLPLIIEATLINISNDEEEIRNKSVKTNDLLLKIVATHSEIDTEDIWQILKNMFGSKKGKTAEKSLQWMRSLLKNNQKNQKTFPAIDEILKKLIDKLNNFEGDQVQNVLDVLGNIMNDQYFDKVIENILNVCYNGKKDDLDRKSDIIVKKLCSNQDSRKVFQSFANQLKNYQDIEFVATFLQSLDNILLTDKQLGDVRNLLKNMNYEPEKFEKAKHLFENLFQIWSFNPVSTITLCLLAQQYDLAYKIIQSFAEIEIDQNMIYNKELVQNQKDRKKSNTSNQNKEIKIL
ncbi:Armadillo-type fold [Pseudocohnilembus persalinus]|uniref:Armadillo-type fold n=1 Tax=Pseudocohnilembus persalinus TaxID=266149 RepID=A0A0V0QZ39_PSEPJ|nr:Armadillo-type fold [Pseudocohnilembus persalinus]|eukprot:KRX07492.1 Armadillo-type fold [Pseudocohnilembus persalinus]